MHAKLFGADTQPAVAVIGVWDPLLPAHHDLFARLRDHARANGLTALVILLDPPPVSLQQGITEWPVYTDTPTRIRQILSSGVDAVLRVHLSKDDIWATAAMFLQLVSSVIPLRELWLGPRQTLGHGPGGRFKASIKAAEMLGVHVHILPPVRLASTDVRGLLKAGSIQEAISVVGHMPLRSRPRVGQVLRFCWPSGLYWVAAVEDATGQPSGRPMDVWLTPIGDGLCALEWPDRRIKYLAFVSGPGDAMPVVYNAGVPVLESTAVA